MVTVSEVRAFAKSVSSENIGRAHKIFGADGVPYYLVENSRGERGVDGQIIEYTVTWSIEKGFQCNCKCGQKDFQNAHKGVCQHVLCAVAAAEEEKAAMREQVQLQAKEQITSSLPAQQKKVAPKQNTASSSLKTWSPEERHDFSRLHKSRERGRLAILEIRAMFRQVEEEYHMEKAKKEI